MRLKPGVKILGARPELLIGLSIADSVYLEQVGAEVLVTSISDGKHMPGSLHYKGLAADLGIRGLSDVRVGKLFAALYEALGKAEWDLVREADHLHMEFDPA